MDNVWKITGLDSDTVKHSSLYKLVPTKTDVKTNFQIGEVHVNSSILLQMKEIQTKRTNMDESNDLLNRKMKSEEVTEEIDYSNEKLKELDYFNKTSYDSNEDDSKEYEMIENIRIRHIHKDLSDGSEENGRVEELLETSMETEKPTTTIKSPRKWHHTHKNEKFDQVSLNTETTTKVKADDELTTKRCLDDELLQKPKDDIIKNYSDIHTKNNTTTKRYVTVENPTTKIFQNFEVPTIRPYQNFEVPTTKAYQNFNVPTTKPYQNIEIPATKRYSNFEVPTTKEYSNILGQRRNLYPKRNSNVQRRTTQRYTNASGRTNVITPKDTNVRSKNLPKLITTDDVEVFSGNKNKVNPKVHSAEDNCDDVDPEVGNIPSEKYSSQKRKRLTSEPTTNPNNLSKEIRCGGNIIKVNTQVEIEPIYDDSKPEFKSCTCRDSQSNTHEKLIQKEQTGNDNSYNQKRTRHPRSPECCDSIEYSQDRT